MILPGRKEWKQGCCQGRGCGWTRALEAEQEATGRVDTEEAIRKTLPETDKRAPFLCWPVV